MNVETGMVTEYNENDGIQTSDFIAGSALLLTDGRIAMGRLHDWIIFDPSHLAQSTRRPPDVQITGILLMNQPMPIGMAHNTRRITLPYNKNALTFQFSTLTFQNRYAVYYKLAGLDNDWTLGSGWRSRV